MTPKRALALWGPVVAYAGLVAYLSSRPGEPTVFDLVWDKALHAGAYAVLAVLVIRALQGGLEPFRAGSVVAGALAATAYGALEEVHQMFVPGRDPSLRDILADAVGALIAIAFVWLLARLGTSGRRRGGAGERGGRLS